MRTFLSGVLATVVAVAVCGLLAIKLGLVPANADAKPGKLETWAAKTALKATIAREEPKGDPPLAPSSANLRTGMELYRQNCQVCHGAAGARPSNIARGLYQKAPQLAKHGVEDDPAGETYWKVTHGMRFTGMPAFANTLNETQRWQVTLFLKHMDDLPMDVAAAWRHPASRH